MAEQTLLCVDDERPILNALKRLLRKEGYRLLTAEDGAEALEALEREPIQVVISDYRMPGMSGTALLREVKSRHPETVRVVLSGYADAHVVVESINIGEIYRFMPKPWNDEELRITIRQCFERYDLLRENERLLHQVRLHNQALQQMNENLERTVAERTRSLQLSQEILEKLPLPVLGVSREGMIVLVNGAVSEVMPADQPVPLGMPMELVLPHRLSSAVERALAKGDSCTLESMPFFDHSLRMHLKILDDGGDVRGCILVMETLPVPVTI